MGKYTFLYFTALFWVITQRVVVISYRRFGTTYRPQRQGSRYSTLKICGGGGGGGGGDDDDDDDDDDEDDG